MQATVLNAAVGNFGASGADRKNRLLRYVSVAKYNLATKDIEVASAALLGFHHLHLGPF